MIFGYTAFSIGISCNIMRKSTTMRYALVVIGLRIDIMKKLTNKKYHYNILINNEYR